MNEIALKLGFCPLLLAASSALFASDNAMESTGRNNRLLIFSLFVFMGVCFIIFIIIILNLVVNLKNAKTQNELFDETLKAASKSARAAQDDSVGVEVLSGIYDAPGATKKGKARVRVVGIPPAPKSEADRTEMGALARTCREIGIQIDQATGRKNNSKNVAELVYKLARGMGVAPYESSLFLSVALVYDIGFLEIDRKLLLSKGLSDAEKTEIRNHVERGLPLLSFVPEKYRSIFADGVHMHHENMDGSGYPEGVPASRIPLIARLLRVAESFIALISRRSYHEICDKESAVDELRRMPEIYDPDIVDMLEQLI